MKKIYLLPAFLMATMLVSCVNEQYEYEQREQLSNKDIAFVFSSPTTRSAEATTSEEERADVSISLGVESGTEYFLTETVEDLNAEGIATRGVPIYDENITTVEGYKSLEVVTYYNGNPYANGTGVFTSMGYQKNVDDRDGWVYKRHYDGALPWPNKSDDLYFYLRMPTDFIDSRLKSGTSITYNNDGSIAFDYNSPLTGEAQKDILFTSRTLNQTEYEENYMETGAPVTMYHALTGVKFRTGNNNSGTTKTIITGVKIKGLKTTGHCVVTPSASGKNADKVVWDKNQLGGSGIYTLGFDNPEYSETSDNTVTYTSGENNTFGASWYSAAADKNLNDEKGSLTFWLIPQEIPDNAILEVTFCVKTPDTSGEEGGGMITHTINNFGAKLKKNAESNEQIEWKAGQLRTYTLEPEVVDVEIFDDMKGLTKKDLHVTNTGNVDEYVRIMVIGNWYDKDGNILVGYATDDPDDPTMATPWFREDEKYGAFFDNTFKFARPANGNKWVRGTGSYYYYPEKIGAGTQLASATDAIFKSYELPQNEVPTIYLPDGSGGRKKAEGVHLVMEVVIQAIGTKDADGNEYKDCWTAWSAATGETIKEKPFKDNNTGGSGGDTGGESGENTEG